MINFSDIQQIICEGEGTTPKALKNHTRKDEIVLSRQFIFYFMRKYTNSSLSKIASYYNKDHATVIYAIKTIRDRVETDKIFRNKFIMYDTRIFKLDKFMNDANIDYLAMIKERLIRHINNDEPINFDLIIVYNRLIEKL